MSAADAHYLVDQGAKVHGIPFRSQGKVPRDAAAQVDVLVRDELAQ